MPFSLAMTLPHTAPDAIEAAIASLNKVKSLTRRESGPWLEADNALQILIGLKLAAQQNSSQKAIA